MLTTGWRSWRPAFGGLALAFEPGVRFPSSLNQPGPFLIPVVPPMRRILEILAPPHWPKRLAAPTLTGLQRKDPAFAQLRHSPYIRYTRIFVKRESMPKYSARCRNCRQLMHKLEPGKPARRPQHYCSTPCRDAAYAASDEHKKHGARPGRVWENVHDAVKAGKLKRQPCEVCGSIKRIHAHHDDYSKPYDVKWLCPKHHVEWHQLHGYPPKPEPDKRTRHQRFIQAIWDRLEREKAELSA